MQELKQEKIWVNYILFTDPDDPNGKPKKIPKNPNNGYPAKVNDPKTWGTYEKALSQIGQTIIHRHDDKGGKDKFTYTEHKCEIAGIGFCFNNNLVGIDIDKCRNDPEKEKQANKIINHFNSYTEISPSGDGYHILIYCDLTKLPANYKEIYDMNPHKHNMECYVAGVTKKYFTYTGNTSDEVIEDRTQELIEFLDTYMKKSPSDSANTQTGGTGNSAKDNYDIISIIQKSKQVNKFTKLFYQGDISGAPYNGDDSAADLGLCSILAWYCQGDFNEIDRYFRQSALYREKWERTDYRTNTINRAINGCNGKFYKPRNKTKKDTSPIKVHKYDKAIYINPFETPEARQRYRWNDIGMGYLFADTYKNISRYVPEAKEWYIYDGRVWRLDLGGVVIDQQARDLMDYLLDCRRFLENDESQENWIDFISKRMKKSARDTMLSDAQSVYPVSIMEFDKDPYIFNCQNITLNLREFTQHPHRPEDFLSKISNANFDPAAKCERWNEFINEIMCSDMETAQFIQKALGYALTGDTSEECFFILYGSTSRNGKGTTMETTLHIMGDYGHTTEPETITQKQNSNAGNPSEDIAGLKGARFVNISEPDKGIRLNNALIKRVTGGDSIRARFLHQNSFEFRPQFKLFLNTNHLPRVSDDTVFKSERVKLIPFERHFEPNEQDKGLKNLFKQPENISGILNWFIDGLKLMRKEGLKPPEKVNEATKNYREESDTIGLFIRECLIEAVNIDITLKDVHLTYTKWCENYGYNPLNSRNFSAELRKKGLKIDNGNYNKVYIFDYDFSGDIPKEWRN